MSSLSKYVCHKEVMACKIDGVEWIHGLPHVMPSGPVPDPIPVDPEWLQRYRPSDSDRGYYVEYVDGYQSWSPSKAFEEGYRRVPEVQSSMGHFHKEQS